VLLGKEGARSKARGKGKGKRQGKDKRLSKVKRAHQGKGRILQGLAGTSFEGLHYKLEDKLGLYQVPCVFTCCNICFEISNIYLSL
jgi:hypothetical protein